MPLPLRFAFLFALCAVALGGIAAQPTFSSWTTINQQPYRYLTDVNILHSSQSVSLTLWVSYEYDCHFYFDYPTELDSTGVFCTYAPIECSIGKGDQTVVCTSFSQDLYYNQGSSSFSVLSGLSGTALIPSVGSAEWVTVIDSSFNLHQRIGGLGSSGSWTSIASNVLYASVGLDGTLCFLTTTSNSPLCCALLSTGGCSSPPENGIPYGAAVGCSVSDRNNIICWDGYGNLHYVVNGFDVATWSWYAIPMPSGVTVSSAFLSETPGAWIGRPNIGAGVFNFFGSDNEFHMITWTACVYCGVGTYANCGTTLCNNCAVGTYSNTAGPTTCTACSEGKYAASTGLSVCSGCATGMYSTATGATSSAVCEYCLPHTYGPSTGMSACDSCPACGENCNPNSNPGNNAENQCCICEPYYPT